jgi:hypothetical protein
MPSRNVIRFLSSCRGDHWGAPAAGCTSEEKARIVVESFEKDTNISEVARHNDVSRGLLAAWKRSLRER